MDADSIWQRLREIEVLTANLDVSDAAGHRALDLEKQDLVEQARALSVRQDRTHLIRRLEQLERQLEAHMAGRLGSANVGAATGMGGGIDPEIFHQMNATADAGANIDELKQEILDLRHLLAGHEPPRV
ncbi:MAG: hypothetical protein OES24_22965 [Acidimicrobiia bacterium]|nr:hypothetical protein [Acidimicrobiia bacterium]